jgi:hypothetical protein
MKLISTLESLWYDTTMDGAPPTAPKRRPRRTLEQRLDAARLKESEAKAKLIRRNREVEKYEGLRKTRERKLDTRRKIIAGGLALKHMRFDPEFGASFRRLLDKYIETEAERLLFGLPALPNPPAPPPGGATPSESSYLDLMSSKERPDSIGS